MEQLKFLIVEDQSDISASLRSYFSKRNVAVSSTGSGLEALELIKVSRPDIVLLDVSLKDLTGIEVLKRLREYDKSTKVVIITGQMFGDDELAKIYSYGVNGYKQKPLALAEVEKMILEACGRHTPLEVMLTAKEKEMNMRISGEMVHRLSVLLGEIRQKCEDFTTNVDNGAFAEKSDAVMVQMSEAVMKEIKTTVDRSMEIIKKIKESDEV